MSEYARLIIAVDSTQVKKGESALLSMGRASSAVEKNVDALTGAAKRLAGPLATFLSVREVYRATEAYTGFTNRMRLVTGSAVEMAAAQQAVFKVAQAGRQPLTETAELYQRIATNQTELGLTGAGVARVTETISKSLAISGTSAASAAGALTQLGQAFASGQLRGEELNSVLENAPALAQAIARGMNVTVGQLRTLGGEGKLTAQAVVDALLQQSDAMDATFEKLAPNISGALTTVSNSLTQLIGKMDEAGGTSGSLAQSIMTISDTLSDPATVEAAQTLGSGVATALSWIVTAANNTVGTVKWMAEELAATFGGIAADDIVRLEEELARLEGMRQSGPLDRLVFFGRDGAVSYYNDEELDAEIAKIRQAIQAYYDLAAAGAGIGESAENNKPKLETFRTGISGLSSTLDQTTKQQKKALADLLAQSAIATASANAMADAYLAGADSVRELTLEQKVEEQLLRTGASARGAVTKALRDQQQAMDRLDIAKNIADIRQQNKDLQAELNIRQTSNRSLALGREAQKAYNVEKQLAAALAGKSADALSDETEELRRQLEIQEDLREEMEAHDRIAGLIDSTATAQERLNRRLEELSELRTWAETPEQIRAIDRAMQEAQREASQWAQWTESALERVDSAFADAWRNIGDGFSSFRDNLVNAFKQMLAELAHLAITRPIVLQIGAAMGIGGAAAQLSSMGGGGFDLIGMLGRGVSLSQSGFGQAVMSGWKSGEGVLGGLQGAFSSGSSYVSGLFGGGGAAGAGTGSTIAGYTGPEFANWVAQQNMAAQTWGGAATSMGAILGGLGGAYMGWQQNGLKGAVGTGLASWGGGALGGMGGAALGQAIGGTIGSVLPGIGTAIGAALGGLLGGSLFGGSGERFKRTVGSATGSYIDGQYVSGGQSQTWFAGYHRTFGDEFNQTLDDLNRSFSATLGGLFDAFDIDSTIETETRARQRRTSGRLAADFLVTIDGEMAKHLRQYGGKGDVAKAMEKFADDIMGEYLAKTIVNSALPEYLRDQFRGLTEADQVAETLAGVIARFDGVNSALELVGLTSLSTTDAGLRAADAIVALSGGIESLTGSVSVYYDQFFTVAEKQADTISAVEKAFEAANITLAESREGYRAMVEDIDVTTEAGQQMFATMMSLSGMAAEYYSILEQRAAQSLAAAQEAAAMQAAMQAAQAAQIAAATQSAAQSAISAARGALSGLSAAIQAEQGRIAASYQAQSSSLQQSLMAANSSLSEMRLVASKLRSTVSGLRLESEQYAALTRQAAQQTIRQALGGDGRLQMTSELERALDTASKSSTGLFGAFEDYARDYWQTYFAIEALAERAEDQVSIEEQAVKALEARVSQAQAFHNAEMARLDEMYESAVQQLNALLGIDDSVQDVGTAMERFAATISALQKLQDANASITSVVGLNGVRRQVASDGTVLGDTGESMGLRVDGRQVVGIADHTAGWRFDLGADGQMSWAAGQDESMMEWARRQGIPGFASGGLFGGGMRLVGENGPELEVTGPSRIYTADQTARMLGGGAETAAAISRLEQTVARQGDALRAIAKHTMKSARNTEVLERWDFDGMPEGRAIA